ncbi:hypothetical protein EDD85DRAFT_995746 [Armillaria nabsnona]|nr:hypothetical protein EDD85DRAFT_995746 [Armillaria nabsnona]
MTTQRGGELPELYSLPATAFSAPSRASLVKPVHGKAQLTTTVPVRRLYVSNPNASYTGYVREYVPSPSPPVLSKLRHRYIPLSSQTESDTAIIMHPLLRPSRGEKIMERDFACSLPSVRVLGHEGSVKEVATSLSLPSLAIVHRKLPWPVVIQRSGDREWVTVPDVVETLWHALQIRDPVRSSLPSLLENRDDAPCTSCRSTLGCGARGCSIVAADSTVTTSMYQLCSTDKDQGLPLENLSLTWDSSPTLLQYLTCPALEELSLESYTPEDFSQPLYEFGDRSRCPLRQLSVKATYIRTLDFLESLAFKLDGWSHDLFPGLAVFNMSIEHARQDTLEILDCIIYIIQARWSAGASSGLRSVSLVIDADAFSDSDFEDELHIEDELDLLHQFKEDGLDLNLKRSGLWFIYVHRGDTLPFLST